MIFFKVVKTKGSFKALTAKLEKNIADIVNMPIEDVHAFFEELLPQGKGKKGQVSWKEGLRKDEILVVERVAKEILKELLSKNSASSESGDTVAWQG